MKKIQQFIILLAVLTFAAAGNDAKAQQIELGGWNSGEWDPIFVPKSSLDTIKCLTHIPEGYSVKRFRIAATIDGFAKEATSNSEYLTPKQRGILTSVTYGSKIYVEDITLIKNSTNEEVAIGMSTFKVVDKPIAARTPLNYQSPIKNEEKQIELGGWNTGDYHPFRVPKAALDTITCLTNIPDGFSIRSFNLSTKVDGMYKSTTSYSAKLTDEQRAILKELPLNGFINIDIILETVRTKEKATTDIITFIVVDKPEPNIGKRPSTKVEVVGNDDSWIFTNIGLGIYDNHNKYIPSNAVETVTRLTNIPENHQVIQFTLSATIRGFTLDATSKTADLTAQQRKILHDVPAGGKIYIDDIKLKNGITGKIENTETIILIKDGIDARCDWGEGAYEDYYRPKIYVYPSFGSKNDDTTHYVVQSFRIEATNPDYVFLYEIDGNKIDSITFSHLTQHNTSGWQGSHDIFWIRDIRCKEVATGKDVSAPDIKPSKENIYCYIYRSKNFFLNSNSKIDFFYKPNFRIDSVCVRPPSVYANVVPDAISKFNGDVFPKDFKAFVKNMKPFTALVFYIYHDGKEEEVNVMIVE